MYDQIIKGLQCVLVFATCVVVIYGAGKLIGL